MEFKCIKSNWWRFEVGNIYPFVEAHSDDTIEILYGKGSTQSEQTMTFHKSGKKFVSPDRKIELIPLQRKKKNFHKKMV